MKRRKNNIIKTILYIVIPFVNILTILIVSAFFSGQNPVKVKENHTEQKENNYIKNISVYFHKTDEVKNLNIEEYLVGVLPAEMPPSFNIEALKAQAVAARTFIINREGVNDEKHKGATICTDPQHCKAYMSEDEADEKWGLEWDKTYKNKIKRAVNETSGQIVTYNNEPISAVFHSTSSGKTENSEDVWQSALPYLRSVESEGEEMSPRYQSTVTVSYNEFKEKIKSMNKNAFFSKDKSDWVGDISYNESGSVKSITLGNVEFSGVDIRSAFGLRSANFKIVIKDNVVFNVTGNGHGVGMSQYGANYAANNGYTYDKILKKYYSGVEINDMYKI